MDIAENFTGSLCHLGTGESLALIKQPGHQVFCCRQFQINCLNWTLPIPTISTDPPEKYYKQWTLLYPTLAQCYTQRTLNFFHRIIHINSECVKKTPWTKNAQLMTGSQHCILCALRACKRCIEWSSSINTVVQSCLWGHLYGKHVQRGPLRSLRGVTAIKALWSTSNRLQGDECTCALLWTDTCRTWK